MLTRRRDLVLINLKKLPVHNLIKNFENTTNFTDYNLKNNLKQSLNEIITEYININVYHCYSQHRK